MLFRKKNVANSFIINYNHVTIIYNFWVYKILSTLYQIDVYLYFPFFPLNKSKFIYTRELYKKDLHDPDNHGGVITHLEPDILECKVKWASGSITINKLDWRWWDSSWAISNPKWWCFESAALNMPANLENSAVATGLEKVRFHPNTKERQC